MQYTIGEVINWCGKQLQVVNIYQLDPDYMIKYDLYYQDRVTMVNVQDPHDKYDFAYRTDV